MNTVAARAVDRNRAQSIAQTRIAPRADLLKNVSLIVLAVPLPLFAVIMLLGSPVLAWSITIGGFAVAVLVAVGCRARLQSAQISVDDTAILYRSLLGRSRTITLSRADSLVLAQVYAGSSSHTLPQLLILTDCGVRLLRIRGMLWSEESIRSVASAIGCRLNDIEEPLTATEFRHQHLGGARWFENPRVTTITIVVSVALGAATAVLGLMSVLGTPFFWN